MTNSIYNFLFKEQFITLAGVPHWLNHGPQNQRVSGLILCQGHKPGLWDCSLAQVREHEGGNESIVYNINVSFSFPVPRFHALSIEKKKKISAGEDFLKSSLPIITHFLKICFYFLPGNSYLEVENQLFFSILILHCMDLFNNLWDTNKAL